MTDVWEWCEFLWARIAEEQRVTEGAGLTPDGIARPWELTEAGAADLGVRAGDHVLATVRTGRGPWADHIVAEHRVRTQPRHTLAELDALASLVDLLAFCVSHELPVANEVFHVAVKFAARYREHPDHPEQRQS
ncbi:DUF6221 family protein [Streptomyces sp. NPDC005962]|uniref:DUF6221 family protein n=1 Tax=Streptomyces sp. NPDC005962 TaxID=3154466 RepID=UPI0033D1A618